MISGLFILLQYIVPQHLLSRTAGWFAASKTRWLKNTMIRLFIRKYSVNMDEAVERDIDAYPSFNAFFTRHLKPGCRPLDDAPGGILCPADGTISAIGGIEGDRMFQAKGKDFSLTQLVAGRDDLVALFKDGAFVNIYLSPTDYHRVHMPFAGTLREMIFVPGQLFSVNQATCERVPGLFARNERAICLFDTAIGPMAVILVGAMIVAGIETVWEGHVAPAGRTIHSVNYTGETAVSIDKGEEMGLFKAGSTVIALFGPDAVDWAAGFAGQSKVRMGQALGKTRV